MQEVGMINSAISAAISRQGHADLMMVVDAGFACPDDVELIDIALSEGVPTVLEVIAELLKYHSVEKIFVAREMKQRNPSTFKKVKKLFGAGVEVEVIPNVDMRARSHGVKTIIRTGDFTAWGNVLMVSGAGNRWKIEKK
jgi:D-ribose pyranase